MLDLDSGDLIFGTSSDLGMSSDGDLFIRTSDFTAMDLNTGDLHMVSGWLNDDEDD